MSYCRWSSDAFKCDVYCYEHFDGGFQIHVAGKRPEGHITAIDWSTPERLKETYEQQRIDMDAAPLKPIGLKYDGQSFHLADAEECLEMMRHLKETGYNVPDYAIEALAEETGAEL